MGKPSLQQWVNKGPKVSALGAAYGSAHEGSVGGKEELERSNMSTGSAGGPTGKIDQLSN